MMEGLKAALEHVEELRSLRYVERLMPTRA